MYGKKTIIGIIPARGGSKGIPNKNIKILGGKPLIAWTIKEAKKSKYLDRLILSSDSEQIIDVANKFECETPFIRPIELAQDNTSGVAPVFHALEMLSEKYDYVVLLQPTSPLRKREDIDRCIEKCIDLNWPACVTVTEAKKSPYWMYQVDDSDDRIIPVMKMEKRIGRRQELPKVYLVNGAVYVAHVEWLLNRKDFITDETHCLIMPAERSVDIDTDIDLKFADFLLQK